MVAFIKKIGSYSFSFSPIATPDGFKLFVAVIKDNERFTTFKMKQDYYGQWKILLPAPKRILNREAEIAALIIDESKKWATNNRRDFL